MGRRFAAATVRSVRWSAGGPVVKLDGMPSFGVLEADRLVLSCEAPISAAEAIAGAVSRAGAVVPCPPAWDLSDLNDVYRAALGLTVDVGRFRRATSAAALLGVFCASAVADAMSNGRCATSQPVFTSSRAVLTVGLLAVRRLGRIPRSASEDDSDGLWADLASAEMGSAAARRLGLPASGAVLLARVVWGAAGLLGVKQEMEQAHSSVCDFRTAHSG